MPTIGEYRAFPNGNIGRWDGTGWVKTSGVGASAPAPDASPSLADRFVSGARGTASQVIGDALDAAGAIGQYGNPMTAPLAVGRDVLQMVGANDTAGKISNVIDPTTPIRNSPVYQGVQSGLQQGADPTMFALGQGGVKLAEYLAPMAGEGKIAASATDALSQGLPATAGRMSRLLRSGAGWATEGMAGAGGVAGLTETDAKTKALEGASGAIGSGLAGPFLDKASRLAWTKGGNLGNQLAGAANELEQLSMIFDPATGQMVPDTMAMTDAAQVAKNRLGSLVNDYKSASKIELDAARKIGNEKLQALYSYLKSTPAGHMLTDFERKNVPGVISTANEMADNIMPSITSEQIGTKIARLTDDVHDVALKRFNEAQDLVAQQAGVQSLDGITLTQEAEDGLRKSAADIASKIRERYQGMDALNKFNGELSILDDFAQKPLPTVVKSSILDASGNPAVVQEIPPKRFGWDQMREAKRALMLLRARGDDFILGQRSLGELTSAVDNAMYSTLAQKGGKDLADAWRTNNAEMRDIIDMSKDAAFKAIVNRVKSGKPQQVANIISSNPEITDRLVKYLTAAGMDDDQLRRFLGRGIIQDSLAKGFSPELGAQGLVNGSSLVNQLVKQYPADIRQFVLGPVKQHLDEFAGLVHELNMTSSPIIQSGGQGTQNIGAFMGQNIEAGAEVSTANALSSGNVKGVLEALFAKTRKRQALENVTLRNEILAHAMVDPDMLNTLNTGMREWINSIRTNGIGRLSERIQARIQQQLAIRDPQLYRKLYAGYRAGQGAASSRDNQP